VKPVEWIRGRVTPTGPVEVVHERPWSTVMRVPVAGGAVWFKACGSVQRFEPRLTAALASRSDLPPRVVAVDEERAWLLLEDAGSPLMAFDDRLDTWLAVLPLYAELQRRETAHVEEHLAGGVPDLRLETLAERYELLAARDLPLARELRAFAPRFDELRRELAVRGVPPSIQHDDLHSANVYSHEGSLAVLDWGDASIGHPYFSLVATLHNEADHAPFSRLRDAYLEPWGGDVETFELALEVGWFAYAIAWLRQRDHLETDAERADFDREFANVLRHALSGAQP
jgi:Phosphotransferase enzyme family